MQKLVFLLRRLLLSAGFFAGLLLFWLPAHEVFEGPKTFAFLIYSSALAVLSLPLLAGWPARRPRLSRLLLPAAALLAASLLSFLGAWTSLPSNLLLCAEKLAPMLAAALSALVFVLESEETRKRCLFSLGSSHGMLVLYGLIQLLDQNLERALPVQLDMIRWTSFGESRVYSSMGNPDYMAAQLTLWLPLWFGLGWRRPGWRPAACLQAAAWLLLLLPLPLVLLVYGPAPAVLKEMSKSYWAWSLVCAAFGLAARHLHPRTVWLGFAYLCVLLVVVAQGRGAYAGLALSALVMLMLAGRETLQTHRTFFRRNAAALGLLLLCFLGLLALRKSDPAHPLLRFTSLQSVLRVTDSIAHRLVHLFDSKADSTVVRLFYYQAALKLGLRHPLWGVGYGNHALFTVRAQSEVWKEWERRGSHNVYLVEPHVELYTHNDFLQNFAETGAVGLLAFLWFWTALLAGAWRLWRRGDAEAARMGLGLLGLGTAFFASAMTNFPWRVLASQQTAWLAFALLASYAGGGPCEERTLPKTAWAAGLAMAFALALFPARWFFASCLFKQGNLGRDAQDWKRGEKFYAKAERAGLSGTQRVELYLYLGSMHNSLGRDDLAEAWFRRGVEIYPDFLEARYNLGYTYMTRYAKSLREDDRRAAVAAFEAVLDLNPRYTSALNNLGNLYYHARDYAKAASSYEKLLRFAPRTLEARYNLGASYLLLGRTEEAKAQLQEALKIHPDYPPAKQLYDQIKNLPKGAVIRFK